MKQAHSHPILGRSQQDVQKQEPGPEPEAQTPTFVPVPVPQHPVVVPSFITDKDAKERRMHAEIAYADPASVLEPVFDAASGIEDSFTRSILYVGSGSYSSPVITILQGLQDLGFTIYTLHKPNINSWYCNQVIDSTAGLKFDFVLSDIGWGVRWSHYSRYRLNRFPNILIDGIFAHAPWEKKVSAIYGSYRGQDQPDNIDEPRDAEPCRWVEDIGKYDPDLVFSVVPGDGIYIPTGMNRESMEMFQDIPVSKRDPMPEKIDMLGCIDHIGTGEALIDPQAAKSITADVSSTHPDGTQGWKHWVMFGGYFDHLNTTPVTVHRATDVNFWDALSCGCLPLLQKQKDDISSYPVTDLFPFCVFQSQADLQDKYNWLREHPAYMYKLRSDCASLAVKYFSPVPLARRFLLYIKESIE